MSDPMPEILVNQLIFNDDESNSSESHEDDEANETSENDIDDDVVTQPPKKLPRQCEYPYTIARKLFELRESISKTTNPPKRMALFTGEVIKFKKEAEQLHLFCQNKCIKINTIIKNIPDRLQSRLEFLAQFLVPAISEPIDQYMKNKIKRYEKILHEVISTYTVHKRIKRAFHRLYRLYRLYKLYKLYNSSEKEVDIITLSPIEKPVYVIDMSVNKIFTFEAKSISNSIQSNLLYQENLFAVPLLPKNPKTNVAFTYPQIISIYYQIKQKGELQWTLATLREHHFNIQSWKLYYRSRISMTAISNNIRLMDSYDSKEMLLDFIISKLYDLDKEPTEIVTKAYEYGVNNMHDHPYIQSFKPLLLLHYESQHLNLNLTHTINYSCLQIFKKQNKFIKELILKKLIN